MQKIVVLATESLSVDQDEANVAREIELFMVAKARLADENIIKLRV